MREIRQSGSEGGEAGIDRPSLPLKRTAVAREVGRSFFRPSGARDRKSVV